LAREGEDALAAWLEPWLKRVGLIV
jgi:hypothetical protein